MPTKNAPLAIALDHVTIVSDRICALRDFFCDVVGLADGPRPPFAVDGHRIYADGHPAIHLIDATVAAGSGRVTPRIDHFALRVHGDCQWEALLARVRRSRLPYATSVGPLAAERQLFVTAVDHNRA